MHKPKRTMLIKQSRFSDIEVNAFSDRLEINLEGERLRLEKYKARELIRVLTVLEKEID